MPAKTSYSVDIITPDDKEATLQFLRANYYRDGPINKCLELYKCPELEKWCVDLLNGDVTCFKATTDDGTIIGVYLTARISSTDKFCPHVDDNTSPNFRVEMDFLAHIDREYNLFRAYPQCSTALEAGILSVNAEYRGLGIAKALTERTVQYAREAGFPLILCHCSSTFSARVCAATGFQRVYSTAFADYVVDGKCPVRPDEPHREFAVYVYEV